MLHGTAEADETTRAHAAVDVVRGTKDLPKRRKAEALHRLHCPEGEDGADLSLYGTDSDSGSGTASGRGTGSGTGHQAGSRSVRCPEYEYGTTPARQAANEAERGLLVTANEAAEAEAAAVHEAEVHGGPGGGGRPRAIQEKACCCGADLWIGSPSCPQCLA